MLHDRVADLKVIGYDLLILKVLLNSRSVPEGSARRGDAVAPL